jgi:hypothetical protein
MTHVDIAWDNRNRVWLATARGPDNAPGFMTQDRNIDVLKQRVCALMGDTAYLNASIRIVTPIKLGNLN